jgi:uncharacterized membrane protein YphA (DoxX/SURF4 family)
MSLIVSAIQIIVALGLCNVWLLRSQKSSQFRGGSAKNMKEEFLVYGLPVWFMYLVGFLKIAIAISLLVGFWTPVLLLPAASMLVVLMLGAIAMHIKVHDSFIKMFPAVIMFALASFLTWSFFFV